jgi:hypothetical protein
MAQAEPGGYLPGTRSLVIDTNNVNVDHCMALVKQWHDLRSDFEKKLFALTRDTQIRTATTGQYRPEVFNGHCDGNGSKLYKFISAAQETFRRVHELYDDGLTTPPISSSSSRNSTIA